MAQQRAFGNYYLDMRGTPVGAVSNRRPMSSRISDTPRACACRYRRAWIACRGRRQLPAKTKSTFAADARPSWAERTLCAWVRTSGRRAAEKTSRKICSWTAIFLATPIGPVTLRSPLRDHGNRRKKFACPGTSWREPLGPIEESSRTFTL